MNIILFLLLIFCFFLSAFSAGLAGKLHKNILLENTIAANQQNNPQLLQLAKDYRKRLWQLASGFSVVGISLLFSLPDSLFFSLFFVLLFSFIGTCYFVKIKYIDKMHQLVTSHNWQPPTEPLLIDTQLVLHKNQQIVSWLAFIPSLILWGISNYYFFHTNLFASSWLLSLTSLGLILICILGWYTIFRLPVNPLTDDAAINQQLNNLTRHHWSWLMITISWILSSLVLLPFLINKFSGSISYLLTGLMIFLILFLLFWTFWYLFTLRKKQDALLKKTSTYRYTGEDYYWRYGVYLNPKDFRLFVPDRIGFNITCNLGNKAGKSLAAAVGVLLLTIFFFLFGSLYFLDFSANPLTATFSEDQLIFKAPFSRSFTIETDQITDISLENELSKRTMYVRTFGIATNNYLLGNFYLKGQETKMYVDLNCSPILVITIPTGKIYYTNKTPEKTRQLYDELKALPQLE